MIYLSPLTRLMVERRHPYLGAIVTPDSSRRIPPGFTWAADNGCFAAGERFRLGRYLAWLERDVWDKAHCLFATAPDVVGNAEATWHRGRHVLPILRDLGYRAGYVAQDGLTLGMVPWPEFDVLFIGGTTEWKRSEAAWTLVHAAKARGVWVHVGRVNGEPLLRMAAANHADSADGTGIVRAPDELWPRVTGWLDRLAGQSPLWEVTA